MPMKIFKWKEKGIKTSEYVHETEGKDNTSLILSISFRIFF